MTAETPSQTDNKTPLPLTEPQGDIQPTTEMMAKVSSRDSIQVHPAAYVA